MEQWQSADYRDVSGSVFQQEMLQGIVQVHWLIEGSHISCTPDVSSRFCSRGPGFPHSLATAAVCTAGDVSPIFPQCPATSEWPAGAKIVMMRCSGLPQREQYESQGRPLDGWREYLW